MMGGEGVGIDGTELAMSQQVCIGDRVVIQIKKSSKQRMEAYFCIQNFCFQYMSWNLRKLREL